MDIRDIYSLERKEAKIGSIGYCTYLPTVMRRLLMLMMYEESFSIFADDDHRAGSLNEQKKKDYFVKSELFLRSLRKAW